MLVNTKDRFLACGKRPQTRTFRIVSLLLLWSVAIHLPGITSPLLDFHAWRQTQTASVARNYVQQGMHFLSPAIDTEGPPRRAGTEFPLYSFLLALLFKAFGVHDMLGRLLSSVFAAGSAVALFVLVSRKLGDRVGFLSALVMCAIPVHVYFTRTVQPESLALFSFLVFLSEFDRWADRDGGFLAWVGAVFIGVLAPLSKLPYLYLLLGLWIVLGFQSFENVKRRFLFWLAPLVITAMTWSWYRYAQNAPVQFMPFGAVEQLDNLRILVEPRFWNKVFISRFPELCATYGGLLLGVAGAWRLSSMHERPFFLGWFSVTCVYSVLLGRYGFIHQYTSLPFAPIVAVFAANGAVRLWDQGAKKRAPRAIAVVLLTAIPVHSALRIAHWYKSDLHWMLRAKDVVSRLSAPEEFVLVNTTEPPVLMYQLKRYGYAKDLGATRRSDPDLCRASILVTPILGSWTDHPTWRRDFLREGESLYRDDDFEILRIHCTQLARQ